MNKQYEELKKASAEMVDPDAKYVLDTAKLMEETINKPAPNAKLPEIIFKEHFVEFFKTYSSNTAPTEADSTTYARWLTIAGSEFNEVDIIDDKGNVIFTVPPMLTKPNVDYKATRTINVNDTAYDAVNKFNRTPAESSNFITNKVSKLMSGAITVDTNEDESRWKRILNRYKNPEAEEQEKLEEQKKKIPTVVKEDLGLNYD